MAKPDRRDDDDFLDLSRSPDLFDRITYLKGTEISRFSSYRDLHKDFFLFARVAHCKPCARLASALNVFLEESVSLELGLPILDMEFKNFKEVKSTALNLDVFPMILKFKDGVPVSGWVGASENESIAELVSNLNSLFFEYRFEEEDLKNV